MLTISKPLSAGQARTYHAREFAAQEQNYWSRDQQGHSEWQLKAVRGQNRRLGKRRKRGIVTHKTNLASWLRTITTIGKRSNGSSLRRTKD